VPATVVLSFDNLGEAAELEQGQWPPQRPRGAHPSVTVALPRLLERLDRLGLTATFCVEAVNAEDYPAALHEIAAHGHELAYHAWRHEEWGALEADGEAEIIERSRRAFAEQRLDARGFRPPGGELSDHSLGLLRDAGLRWCSPLGERPRLDPTGLGVVPFRWQLVDATYLHAPMSRLRSELGLSPEPLPADEAERLLWDALEGEPEDVATLVLHPFLAAEPGWGEAVARLLERLAGLRDAGSLRVTPVGALADELSVR
jgi:peptidoglycan/xylan/chitin deacetylase (PgdA/CDA1 family)